MSLAGTSPVIKGGGRGEWERGKRKGKKERGKGKEKKRKRKGEGGREREEGIFPSRTNSHSIRERIKRNVL